MLTKTLKFDDDVLGILRTMEWSDDGLLGVLTCGQLERALYVKVNKALSAMGGGWARGKGGHVFKTDPRSQVEGLVENGTMTVERDGFFETPPAVVERMLELVEIRRGDKVFEPSAGLGAIAYYLCQYPDIALHVCEKNPQRAEKLKDTGYHLVAYDFFDLTRPWYDVIVMNPPFENGQDIDHVRHAYHLLDEGGQLVSVMSEGTFFRGDRKATAFREWMEEVGAYNERLPEGSFKETGTGVSARLVVIRK